MPWIAPEAEARVRSDAEAAYPKEACGLLLGADGRATEARLAGNLDLERAHDRYLMDPKDQMRIEREAETKGLKVLGVWHSHPDHPATPSETDRQQAQLVWVMAKSWSYVILEVAKGRASSLRSWVLKDGIFTEEAS